MADPKDPKEQQSKPGTEVPAGPGDINSKPPEVVNPQAAAEEEAKKSVHLEVRSKTEAGFRRLGRLYSSDPVEGKYTPEEAEILRNEPQLIVRDLSARSTLLGTGDASRTPVTHRQPPR